MEVTAGNANRAATSDTLVRHHQSNPTLQAELPDPPPFPIPPLYQTLQTPPGATNHAIGLRANCHLPRLSSMLTCMLPPHSRRSWRLEGYARLPDGNFDRIPFALDRANFGRHRPSLCHVRPNQRSPPPEQRRTTPKNPERHLGGVWGWARGFDFGALASRTSRRDKAAQHKRSCPIPTVRSGASCRNLRADRAACQPQGEIQGKSPKWRRRIRWSRFRHEGFLE